MYRLWILAGCEQEAEQGEHAIALVQKVELPSEDAGPLPAADECLNSGHSATSKGT